MPLPTILLPRSQAELLYFRKMDTEFDAVPELVPDWNRHPRLASEMHCTIAHRLTSHTHPTLPVHQQN